MKTSILCDYNEHNSCVMDTTHECGCSCHVPNKTEALSPADFVTELATELHCSYTAGKYSLDFEDVVNILLYQFGDVSDEVIEAVGNALYTSTFDAEAFHRNVEKMF